MMRSVTVNTDVEIDLTEIDTSDLVNELEARGKASSRDSRDILTRIREEVSWGRMSLEEVVDEIMREEGVAWNPAARVSSRPGSNPLPPRGMQRPVPPPNPPPPSEGGA